MEYDGWNMIILGDKLTGKSSLIKSLTTYGRDAEMRIAGDAEHDDTSIRMLEYHSGNEGTIAGEDVSIVIITLDIRVQESANSVFNRWCNIRDKYFGSSLLIVVGNFLDCHIERRVEVVETTRACVKKEAIYFEVSNSTSHENISKLKGMIANYVRALEQKYNGRDSNDIANVMEGLDEWENHLEEKIELNHIGNHLVNIIETLDESIESDIITNSSVSSISANAPAQKKTIKDLKNHQVQLYDTFRILGLSVPSAMTISGEGKSKQEVEQHDLNPFKEHKIKITLPNNRGDATFCVYDGYDIESQVKDFLNLYNMSDDRHAHDRLFAIAKQFAVAAQDEKLAHEKAISPSRNRSESGRDSYFGSANV